MYRKRAMDAYVDEYENLEWGCILSKPHAIASQFCVRKHVTRKAQLAAHVNKFSMKCADRGLPNPLLSVIPHGVVVDAVEYRASLGGFGERSSRATGGIVLDKETLLASCLWDAEEEMEESTVSSRA